MGMGMGVCLFDFASLYQNKPQPRTAEQDAAFKRALKEEGLIAFFRNCMIHVCPPLTITPDELRDGFGRLRRALSSVDF